MLVQAGAPLTPDFVRYECPVGTDVVRVDDTAITIRWSDGVSFDFPHVFLVENAGTDVIDPTTRERLAPITAYDASVRPKTVTIDGGHLRVDWGQRETRHHGGWLRSIADGEWRADHGVPAPTTWDLTVLSELPTHDGPEVLRSEQALDRWLVDVATFGVARLRGLPVDPLTVLRVGERVGVVRDTSFGRHFDVQSKPEADSLAYTAHELAPHTDLPTREVPPGFQLLHCLENTCVGGWSTMVDGWRVAELVEHESPDAYADLVSRAWVHTNRSPSFDYRHAAPILRVEPNGRLEVRLFYALRTVPHAADLADWTRAYASLRAFTEVTLRDELTLRTPFSPGDLVMFDNRRILHGRDAFDSSHGSRHLQGCYVDRDEVHSRLRILKRRNS